MGHLRWLFVALIVTGLPSHGAAQSPLSLDEAVREALAHNPQLVAARAGSAEAAAGAAAAHAAYYPRVTFAESWQRGNQPVYVFSSLLSSRQFAASNFAIDFLNHPDPLGFFRASFGVEQLLFDGGRTRASVGSARLREEMADRGVSQASAEVALGATQAYGSVLAARAVRLAAEAGVKSAEEDHARAVARRDAGTATEADVLSLAVHLANMRQRAIQAAGDEAVARAELNRVTGAPIDRQYEVAEPPPSTTTPRDLAALVAEAEKSRPELARADAARRLAETGIKAAKAGWMPQVGAQAGYELAGTQFNDRASSWVVGGELRWALSIGGAETYQLRAARESLARAQADADAARAGVQVDVISALRRLETAEARRQVASSSVSQARESQRIVRDRFDAGMAGVTDVLRVSTALLDAEAQRVATIVDTIVSEAMLRRATGRQP